MADSIDSIEPGGLGLSCWGDEESGSATVVRSGSLGLRDVHVWKLDLDRDKETVAHLASQLSSEEVERMVRFRFEVHRKRFATARGLVRNVLSRYLNVEPRSLKFGYGAHGKPALAGDFANANLHFNMTHSEGMGLLAIGRNPRLGIDVERVRELSDFDELVARFFSPREASIFQELPPDGKAESFFNLWTRKEALLKATGEGIGWSLNKVEVTFLPQEVPRFLDLPEHTTGDLERWILQAVIPEPGYVGALAVCEEQPAVTWMGPWRSTA